MADNQTGGVRIFKAAGNEELENIVNVFLAGDGTPQNTKKLVTQAPVFLIDGTDFYAMIVYRPA